VATKSELIEEGIKLIQSWYVADGNSAINAVITAARGPLMATERPRDACVHTCLETPRYQCPACAWENLRDGEAH
jgi:hypothetical protein